MADFDLDKFLYPSPNEEALLADWRKDIDQNAVANFLGTLDGLTYQEAIGNCEMDGKSYGWNLPTIGAIREGIALAFRGVEAGAKRSSWYDFVGEQFRAPCWYDRENATVTFTAESYDPGHGFWMVHEREGQRCAHDVSERAIGRTFHKVRKST